MFRIKLMLVALEVELARAEPNFEQTSSRPRKQGRLIKGGKRSTASGPRPCLSVY